MCLERCQGFFCLVEFSLGCLNLDWKDYWDCLDYLVGRREVCLLLRVDLTSDAGVYEFADEQGDGGGGWN